MKFLFILSWFILLGAIIDIIGTIGLNEDIKNKIIGRRFTLFWWTAPGLGLSLSFIIYYFTR